MFTESIVIMSLYVTQALVHCAENDTELNEEHIRNRNRCNSENFNCTRSMMISYDMLDNISDIICCDSCIQNMSEVDAKTERHTANDQLRYITSSIEAKMDFKVCIFNGQIVRIWKRCNCDPNNDVNDSLIKIDKKRGNDTELQHQQQQQQQQQQRLQHCDSLFTSLNFWGANIVIFANIIYIVPYMIVVLVYFAVPGLNTRAYNKAVICYNASQIILNGILIGIGSCVLCHVPIHSNVYIILGLGIMFLTISSTFWLFVICIDMTLVITRFRWTLPTDANQQEEKKKFLTYASWTWGSSLIPTSLACIAELSPLLPKSSSFRPNFPKFKDGANFAVIFYVASFPALTCLANTILFCYTSYKMYLIEKSTTLATANSSTLKMSRKAKKRYFLFLRLYLLMDAPWITSTLAAAFTDLWVLKFLRMIQPILMLLAILPPRTITRIFACNCFLKRSTSIFKLNRRIS